VCNPSDPLEVAADPDYRDLLAYVNLDADTPRVRPRTIVDASAGVDLTDGRGRKTWTAQIQVTNLFDRVALYNFQSVFVGTRLVQPRTLSVRIVRHF
jgi:outer membrane receptor protein involved in Fe transport